MVIDLAAEIEGDEARRHWWRGFGSDFNVLLVHGLGMGFLVRVVAVSHTFTANPRAHKRVCRATAARCGGVFDAYAAVEDDVDATAPVLFDGELVLGQRAGALV
jgi:hypothetical protein